MKKQFYTLAILSSLTVTVNAQNVGINTDGSNPDGDAILHIKNDASSSKDSSVVRIENEQNGANDVTGLELYNSGTGATARWDVYIPASGSTDLRIKNNGTDRITIQNDGDVGIGNTSPTAKLDVDGSAIFNESGADKDFRIEGDTDTEVFFVDGSADAVGISTTSPKSSLDVQGSLGYSVTTITGATTLNQTHNVVLCNTGPYTVTLPAAASNTGKVYYIKNIDSDGDIITIDGNGSETIEGSETFKLGDYKDVVRIVSDGSNWFIIEKSVLFQCGTSTVTFTYNGSSVTYGTVLSSTGECWLDRNLGATRVATSITDTDAYGDLFQWGRGDDGHQDRSSSTTSTNADSPGHGNFILEPNSPRDWRVNQDDNLWNGESATNNPCPTGWRIPTDAEWQAEITTDFTSNNAAGAFGSVLKLPMAGSRNGSTGSLAVGTNSYYWSSTVGGTHVRVLFFNSSGAFMSQSVRAYGLSVRCLKD